MQSKAFLGLITTLAVFLPAGSEHNRVQAAPRWLLVYYRQVGHHVNGGGSTVENHLFREDGSRGAFVGVTNQFNLGFAVWGNAGADGWHRIEPNDAFTYRDVRIYESGVASDQSPNLYHYNGGSQHYGFETHWLKVSEPERISTYPTKPVYHYDLVDGINSASFVEPPGAASDAFDLTYWDQNVYQTFVVPTGINRIVSAKCWGVKNFQYRYIATIHASNGQANPASWPQVGGSTTSRMHGTPDFINTAVNWPLNGANSVPVTPGQTYCLRVRPEDNQGFNSYAVTANNYPQGKFWINGTEIAGRDLCAAVIGVGYDLPPEIPMIQRSPASFARTVPQGEILSGDSFTVRNSGNGTLNYTITDNASWLSVSPASGSSTGETDTINITYDVAALTVNSYSATITISAPGAPNSPQTIAVGLQVTSPIYAPIDFDRDGDVDISDYGKFQVCYTGNGIAQTSPACLPARLDADDDVDVTDLNLLLQCMQGAGVQVAYDCAQ